MLLRLIHDDSHLLLTAIRICMSPQPCLSSSLCYLHLTLTLMTMIDASDIRRPCRQHALHLPPINEYVGSMLRLHSMPMAHVSLLNSSSLSDENDDPSQEPSLRVFHSYELLPPVETPMPSMVCITLYWCACELTCRWILD